MIAFCSIILGICARAYIKPNTSIDIRDFSF